jgi:predicted DNA-binding transcriptional regulator AlpA
MTRDDLLKFDGIEQPISEWALDYGITPEIIMARLHRGMTIERAITKPMPAKPGDRLPEPNRTPATVSYSGRTMTISEWAEATGLGASVIYHRINKGWNTEAALTTPNRRERGVASNLEALSGTGGGSASQQRG